MNLTINNHNMSRKWIKSIQKKIKIDYKDFFVKIFKNSKCI